MDIITLDERERRWQRIREAMEKRGLECLIIWGGFGHYRGLNANLRYLSNTTIEGYLVFPLKDDPTLVTFLQNRLSEADPTSWVRDWRTGHPKYSNVISQRLKELHMESARIGMVGQSGYYGEWGFPYTTYVSVMNNFPAASFQDATDILEEARIIKSPAEIRCFELGCEVGDQVIQSIMNTAKVGVRHYEIVAKMMDTSFREGCEPGAMLLYTAGKDITFAGQAGYSGPPDRRAVENGEIILAEFDAKYLGYIAQYNQPFSVGEPNKEWQELSKIAIEAFDKGLDALRPGITVRELDQAMLSPVREAAGYTYTLPVFHGLGLGLEEPFSTFPAQPEYRPNTSLILKPSMVLEFEPQVLTSDGKKGFHIGSPVLVTETGCRLLSKTWKPEFKIV